MGAFSRYLAASSSPLAAGARSHRHGDGLALWQTLCTSALPWVSICHSSCSLFSFFLMTLLLPLPVFISLSSSGNPPDWEVEQNTANAPHLTGGKQRAQQLPVEQSSVWAQPDTGLPAHIWVTQAVSCENGNAVKSGAKCKNNNAISHSESRSPS